MTRRRLLWVVATVLVATAIGAFALAPPALLDARLARLSAGALRLTGATGTVWRGQGVLVAGTTRMPIAWQIDPWRLVRGEWRLGIAPASGSAGGAPRGEFAIDGQRIAAADVDVTLPAALVAALAAPGTKLVWAPAGDVGLRAASIEWAPPASRGVAMLSWRGAILAVVGGLVPLDLGVVTATLTADGDRLSGPVANAGGDLALSGTLALQAGESLRVSLVLTPRRSDDRVLSQLLSAIGREDAKGWRVEWRLPLP